MNFDRLILFERDGTPWMLPPDADASLDAALTHYLDTERDRLLLLELLSGSVVRIPVSSISCWVLSSQETRERSDELADEMKAETGWSDE